MILNDFAKLFFNLFTFFFYVFELLCLFQKWNRMMKDKKYQTCKAFWACLAGMLVPDTRRVIHAPIVSGLQWFEDNLPLTGEDFESINLKEWLTEYRKEAMVARMRWKDTSEEESSSESSYVPSESGTDSESESEEEESETTDQSPPKKKQKTSSTTSKTTKQGTKKKEPKKRKQSVYEKQEGEHELFVATSSGKKSLALAKEMMKESEGVDAAASDKEIKVKRKLLTKLCQVVVDTSVTDTSTK